MSPPPAPSSTSTAPAATAASVGLAAVLIGYALPNLLDAPQLRLPLIAAGLLAALVWGVAGTWHHRRTSRTRDLAQALVPVLRAEGPKGLVRVQKRKGGNPVKIKITYPATFPDSDEKARAEVRELVATRLGAPVEATWRRPKRQLLCRLDWATAAGDIIERDTPAADEATGDTVEQAAMRARTADVVQAVLGPTASVKDVRFEEGSADPTSIKVIYGTTSRDLSAAFRQKVLMQVDSKIPGDWRDIWNFEENAVRFEKRPPFPRNVPYPVEDVQPYGTLPYCVDEDGALHFWKLSSKDPHYLAVGPTGSGKTVLIRALVLGAIMQGIPVVLCDPKRTEYMDFADVPGVILVTEIKDIASAITSVHSLMGARYAEIEAGLAKKGSHRKFLLVVDEFAIFKDLINKEWAVEKKLKEIKGPADHPCLGHWGNIILMGRTASLHGLLGLQRPDAEVTKGMLRDSMRKRTALDQHTRETAIMMWNSSRTGTNLPSIQGRGISELGRGPREVQVLRVIPPSEDGFTEDDARMWARAMERASDPALWEGVRLPPALTALRKNRQEQIRRLRAHYGVPEAEEAPARVELEKEPAPARTPEEGPDGETAPTVRVDADSEAEEPTGELEEVGVYDLEIGDVVMLEDDTGIPELVTVDDLHFEDGEDGEELVELTYTSHDSGAQEARTFSAEETVSRRPASGETAA